MPEIQQTRYDQLLRRVAGIIGPGSKVGELITDLLPTFDVENMPAELLLLSGTRIAFGGGTLAGAAGTAPKMQLFNPAGSDHLITLTSVIASCDNGIVLRWGRTLTALSSGIGTETFRDSRLIITGLPVGEIRQEAAAALATATNQTLVLANSPLYISDPNDLIVLAPGEGWEIGSGNNNVQIYTSFVWRERTAEQSELQF